jgi:hypothetical protein
MLTIRSATPEDEATVLALVEELFAPPGTRPPGYRRERAAYAYRHAIEAFDADVLLAVDDGRIVGLASVYVDLETIRFGRRCWVEERRSAAGSSRPRRSGLASIAVRISGSSRPLRATTRTGSTSRMA